MSDERKTDDNAVNGDSDGSVMARGSFAAGTRSDACVNVFLFSEGAGSPAFTPS